MDFSRFSAPEMFYLENVARDLWNTGQHRPHSPDWDQLGTVTKSVWWERAYRLGQPGALGFINPPKGEHAVSEIQKKLAEATEVEPSKRKNETMTSQDYMKRLAFAVSELSDDEWKKLSTAAQDWFNEASDAMKAKTDIPQFPDLPKPEKEVTSRRSATPEKYVPAVGDQVKLVTKRGKEIVGKLVEFDSEVVVIDSEGKESEVDRDKVESLELASTGEPAKGGKEPEAEPKEPKAPEVGDTVEVVTKRGKTILGNVKELSDDEMVLVDATGEIHELSKDRLTSVKVKSDNSGNKKADGEKPTEKKKITASDNGGVSATMRMREILCANTSISKVDLTAAMKKEGLDFKPATLDLIFSDTNKIFAILTELKKLK